MKKYISIVLIVALSICFVGCEFENKFDFGKNKNPLNNDLYFTIKDIVYNEEYECYMIVVDWHNPTESGNNCSYEGYDIEYLNGDTFESVFKMNNEQKWVEDSLRFDPNQYIQRSYALNESIFDINRKGTYRIKISYYRNIQTMLPGGDWGPIVHEYTDVYAEFIIS